MSDIPAEAVYNRRTPPPLYVPKNLVLHKDTHQAHIMIGSRGYNAYEDKRTALYLLMQFQCVSGMKCRYHKNQNGQYDKQQPYLIFCFPLNVALLELLWLGYNVESNLTSYTDTGTFCIYFGCDPEDAELCTRLVYKELKRLRDTRMTSSQFAAAKKQLIGQIGVASDNNENNALGMAKTFLHYNKYETAEAVFRRIGQLTPEILLEVANEMFAEDYLSTLVYD